MYLRVTQRRNKDGKVVRYLALAHNERNERGVPVAKIIHNFGREDEVDREALVRLVASISRFLEPEQALAAGAPEGFEFLEAREYGRPHVLQSLWQELGIGRALTRVAGSRRYRGEVERSVFAMVTQRAIAPASKLEATRWAPREVVLEGVGELSTDGLYGAMDFLLACSDLEERDRDRREQTIARLEQELAELEQTRGQAHEKAACKLRAHKSIGRYVRQTKTGRLMVDRAKVRDEEKLDGKYLITTSDDTLTPEDVALGYKNLLEAERGFKDLKGTLLLRPIFHRKEDRIRAHVLICFLALVIIRVCEIRAGKTWRKIGDQLQTIKLGRFRSAEGEFTQRTKLSADQRQLLKALGVPEPPRFGEITPRAESDS